jgi:hypothetical protein
VVFAAESQFLLKGQVLLDPLVALVQNGCLPFLYLLETAMLYCCCFVRLDHLPVFPLAYLVDPSVYLVDVVLLFLVVYCRKD